MQLYSQVIRYLALYSPGIIQLGALHGVIQRLLIVAQVHIAHCSFEIRVGVVGVVLNCLAALPTGQQPRYCKGGYIHSARLTCYDICYDIEQQNRT